MKSKLYNEKLIEYYKNLFNIISKYYIRENQILILRLKLCFIKKFFLNKIKVLNIKIFFIYIQMYFIQICYSNIYQTIYKFSILKKKIYIKLIIYISIIKKDFLCKLF